MHKKHQRGDNSKSMIVRALIFVRDTSSCPVPHNCEVSSIFSKWFSSYRANTKMFTDGRTDGRQAHRCIPRTFRPGDKNIQTTTPAHTASAVGPCPTLFQIRRTSQHWKLTQHHRTTPCYSFTLGLEFLRTRNPRPRNPNRRVNGECRKFVSGIFVYPRVIEFPALSVDPRVGISRSASVTDV